MSALDKAHSLAKEIDALHTRLISLAAEAEMEGLASFSKDLRDCGGYLTDCVSDINFVVNREEERANEEALESRRDTRDPDYALEDLRERRRLDAERLAAAE